MFFFKPNFVPLRTIVVGAGGTGSRLAPGLIQFLTSVPFINQITRPKILFFDGDVVEEKNCIRQNFIRADIGKNKAEVLASRYGRAYDATTKACVRNVTLQHRAPIYDEISTFFGGNGIDWTQAGYLLIMCVDSVAARRDILRVLGPFAKVIIDSGNEDDFGQVSLFSPRISNTGSITEAHVDVLGACGSRIPEPIRLDYLPIPPNYLSERQESERSCADLDQTLAINNMVAAGIVSVIQTLTFQSHPINYHTLHFHLGGSNYTEFLTPHYIKGLYESYMNPGSEGQTFLNELEQNNWRHGMPMSETGLVELFKLSDRGFFEWPEKAKQLFPVSSMKAFIAEMERPVEEVEDLNEDDVNREMEENDGDYLVMEADFDEDTPF